jgi:hypothetical protein
VDMWITGAALLVGSFIAGALIARVAYVAGRRASYDELIAELELASKDPESGIRRVEASGE